MAPPPTPPPSAPGQQTNWKELAENILWGWSGVAATIVLGLVISPIIINKLGKERYGLWALCFSFVEYFLILDFGLKSAVVNRVSAIRAATEDRSDEINEVLSTAFVTLSLAGVAVGVIVWMLSSHIHRFFAITPTYREELTVLTRVVGMGWMAAVVGGVFQGAIEAFQLFKTQNRILVLSLIFRSLGSVLLLYFGFGLIAMGVLMAVNQVLLVVASLLVVRRAFPQLRITPVLARWRVWRSIAPYGLHAVTATGGTLLVNQAPPILVGSFYSEAFVGYYVLPSRLLNYMVELVTKVGFVVMPNATRIAAQGQYAELVSLATMLNRYSLTVFAPVAIFLLTFGPELLRVWVGPEVAGPASELLPFFTLSTLVVASQFNANQILFGLSQHREYAWSLVVEGCLALAIMYWVLPTNGLAGAAMTAAVCAMVNRGLGTALLLRRCLDFPLATYLKEIYLAPVGMALPLWALTAALHQQWPGPRRWLELGGIMAGIAAIYYSAAYFLVLAPTHRAAMWRWVSGAVPALRGAEAKGAR